MTNYRSIKRNELIRIIKNLKKSIKEKCYECIGDQKRIGCSTTDCALFPHRPWLDKQINKNQSDEFIKEKTK